MPPHRNSWSDAGRHVSRFDELADVTVQQLQFDFRHRSVAVLAQEGVAVRGRSRRPNIRSSYDRSQHCLAAGFNVSSGRLDMGLRPGNLVVHHSTLGRRLPPWNVLVSTYRKGIPVLTQ